MTENCKEEMNILPDYFGTVIGFEIEKGYNYTRGGMLTYVTLTVGINMTVILPYGYWFNYYGSRSMCSFVHTLWICAGL